MAALVSRPAISNIALGAWGGAGESSAGSARHGPVRPPASPCACLRGVGDPGDDLAVLVGRCDGVPPVQADLSRCRFKPSLGHPVCGGDTSHDRKETHSIRSLSPQPTKPNSTQRRPRRAALSFAPIANIAAARRPGRGPRRVCRRAMWREPSRSAPAGRRPPPYRLGEPMHAGEMVQNLQRVPGASRRYSMRRLHCPAPPEDRQRVARGRRFKRKAGSSASKSAG